jgi:hypothetical protein
LKDCLCKDAYTPRYGMADFMHACIIGAFRGSANPQQFPSHLKENG